MGKRRIRILIAKPDLDGHDRGAKVVAMALRDAGMEVAYSGLHQNVDQIVRTALEESMDVIGLSIMTGAHLSICQRLLTKLKSEKMENVRLIVGGVIPKDDIAKLKAMGVHGVFPGPTPFDEIVEFIRALFC
ncbi:MAG: cobalamin B12-binding domain-containing protein [Desulfobacterales bacterium]